MSLKMDLIWHDDDDAMQFRAHCATCSYRSVSFDDEEMATAAWFNHDCVGADFPS